MEESVEAKNELILDWVKKHDLKEDEFWYIVEWFKEMSIMKHFVDAMYNIIKNDKYHFYDNKEDLKKGYATNKGIVFELDNRFLILESGVFKG